ncbi:MAG: glycosyltransferase, partial [Planctomycetota bacterium]
MPRFSIVTITYNNCVGLASTIRSVGAQTFRDFEYIVQDGNSNDGSDLVVKGFHDWVDIYNQQADDGIYDAMNKALEHCSGDFTLFMNSSDVFVDSNVLEQANQLLVKGDEIVHGFSIDIDSNLNHQYKPLNDMSFGMSFDHQATLVRTDILKEMKFDDSLRIAGDLDFFCRCKVRGVNFRGVKLQFAKKPFSVGASTDYLTRFRERKLVLLRNFEQQQNEITFRLKAELLEYADNLFESEPLN